MTLVMCDEGRDRKLFATRRRRLKPNTTTPVTALSLGLGLELVRVQVRVVENVDLFFCSYAFDRWTRSRGEGIKEGGRRSLRERRDLIFPPGSWCGGGGGGGGEENGRWRLDTRTAARVPFGLCFVGWDWDLDLDFGRRRGTGMGGRLSGSDGP